jgi:hypothetical protein
LELRAALRQASVVEGSWDSGIRSFVRRQL